MSSIFPKTIELLDEARTPHLKEQFQITAKKDLLVLADRDQSRWFPVFLKMQGVVQKILEVAEFEYIRHLVRQSECHKLVIEEGLIKMNPTIQFVELHYDQPKLGRKTGLYCFYKKDSGFFEFQIGLYQAIIFDLLQEERKYSIQQLVEMAAMVKHFPVKSTDEWMMEVQQMIQMGLLITA